MGYMIDWYCFALWPSDVVTQAFGATARPNIYCAASANSAAGACELGPIIAPAKGRSTRSRPLPGVHVLRPPGAPEAGLSGVVTDEAPFTIGTANTDIFFVATRHLSAVWALSKVPEQCGGVEGLAVAEEDGRREPLTAVQAPD